jgi:phosphomannomutase
MNTHIDRWLSRDPDLKTQQELRDLLASENHDELNDRFSGRLAFGTAGLRGVVGAGPNRMNRLVIQETSMGLGHYLLAQNPTAAEQGVVIGYDGRLDSKQFAADAAGALTALGIKVYLTYKVAATPLVAFGVKHLKTAAGIVVTASHNPPQYNGFKVYWDNGAQIIPPHDSGIAAEIEKVSVQPLNILSLEEAEEKGLLVWLEEAYYEEYRRTQNTNPLLQNDCAPANLSLAYTAMHGVGAIMAETLLKDAGFEHVYSVEEQRHPDGTFPTVNFPNPEEAGAMDMVMALAKKHNAALACANDPDADRFAVAVRCPDGEYQMLTGDQVGVLFGHYLLSLPRETSACVGTTIVSSSLLQQVAKAAGAEYFETLTGFKWLTNVGMVKETASHPYLFAYEEALGYTIGSTVWDKDGLSALVAFAQLTAALAKQGKTVWDQLEAIYRQHGFYFNAQKSLALKPGAPSIGAKLRANQPKTIANHNIASYDDLNACVRYFADGSEEKIDLPASDVLIYRLENGSRVIVRPSGTEPKLKCYYEVVSPMIDGETYEQAQSRAQAVMASFIEQHQVELLA